MHHSFSETQAGSADRAWLPGFAWKPTPSGWSGACCLDAWGEGLRMGSRRVWVGAGVPYTARMDFLSLHITKGYTESQRHRGAHSKVNGRYPKKPARLLQPRVFRLPCFPRPPHDQHPQMSQQPAELLVTPSCGILFLNIFY